MKVFLRTFGCRANQYDSEQVRALIEGRGGELVADAAAADVAVFNSCAVTAQAEADLRKGVRRAARANPSLRTVLMGCAASRDATGLATLPTVRAVIPGGDVAAVGAALGLGNAHGAAASRQTGTRALLRIQDGCDEHCTFCATTLARGANRSREASVLVREAEALARHHAEIVLTGVHIGSWGRDVGSSLGALVEQLVRDVPGVRFRLSSVEATEVDDRLAELFAEPAHLAPHLHAPLQSGSDRVLRHMGRHWYRAADYARAVERLVAGRSRFALGADVIAGFPGESEADHLLTLAMVEALPFTYLHVFPYSARPGTAAVRLPDPCPPAVVHRRARELRDAARRRALRYRAARLGGPADVVVVRGDRREGLTGDFLEVGVADPPLPRGSRVRARLAGSAERLIAVHA